MASETAWQHIKWFCKSWIFQCLLDFSKLGILWLYNFLNFDIRPTFIPPKMETQNISQITLFPCFMEQAVRHSVRAHICLIYALREKTLPMCCCELWTFVHPTSCPKHFTAPHSLWVILIVFFFLLFLQTFILFFPIIIKLENNDLVSWNYKIWQSVSLRVFSCVQITWLTMT